MINKDKKQHYSAPSLNITDVIDRDIITESYTLPVYPFSDETNQTDEQDY